jgi:hypothetical protein
LCLSGEEEDCLIGRYMKWLFLYNDHILIQTSLTFILFKIVYTCCFPWLDLSPQ